jgi:hypothetical protein
MYIALESKAKMKERTRKSPDLADNAVIMAQTAAARCGLSPKESSVYDPVRETPWRRFLHKRNLTPTYVAS